jgi:toxin-antitoxin system PIN domain toxin
MIILDANLLLYSHIPSFKQYDKSKVWLENTISDGNEIVGLSWQVIKAFFRIGTNQRLFDVPLSAEQAVEKIEVILAQPLVELVLPTSKHWNFFTKILKDEQIIGDLVMDAHLAALALEHNASIASTDKDFSRFTNYIKVINPLNI